MRVVVLHASFTTTGGAEVYVRMLCEELMAEGHSVKLITGDDFGIPPHSKTQSKKVRYWFQLMDIFGRSRKKIILAVDEFEPDLVHLHNWARLRSSTVQQISKKYPMLHTIHDYYTIDPSGISSDRYHETTEKIIKLRTFILLRKYKQILFHFPALRTKERFMIYSGIKLENFLVFPLNIKLPDYEFQVSDEHLTFAYIGQLEPHKGILEFAKEFEKFSNHSMSLIIAGDGSEREAIIEIASRPNGISYAGWLDPKGKKQLFDRVSWLVFPSKWFENFPLVCCEALASGVPIVSTDISIPPMANEGAVLTYGSSSSKKDVNEILVHINNMSEAEYLQAVESALSSRQNFQDLTERRAAYDLLMKKREDTRES